MMDTENDGDTVLPDAEQVRAERDKLSYRAKYMRIIRSPHSCSSSRCARFDTFPAGNTGLGGQHGAYPKQRRYNPAGKDEEVLARTALLPFVAEQTPAEKSDRASRRRH